MKQLLRASWWFFVVRCLLALVAATPLGIALRLVASRHPDGDDALFLDFIPRLGDVMLREPRTLGIAAASMLLVLILAPLGEGFVDRTGAGILWGRRGYDALGDAARDLWRAGAISMLGTVFRGAALLCVYGLVRGHELSVKALALPGTLAFLLALFVGLMLAVRDLAMWPSHTRMRERLRVGILVLMHFPLRMIVVALGTRAAQIGFAAIAFVASTRPGAVHGVALVGLYGLAAGCWFAGAGVRAARFQALRALASRVAE